MDNNFSHWKFLVLSGVRGDTRRYRTFHLYQQMRLAGLQVILSDITHPAVFRHAAQCNLVIIHRSTYNSTVQGVIERIRKNGGLVLFDTDDLVFDPAAFDWIDSPDFADPIRERLYREHLDLQRKTLEIADAVFVSTDYLSQSVTELGKPVWIHRNGFSLELGELSNQAYRQRHRDPKRVVIGYASGTFTHNLDFNLIIPALKTILERFPQAELQLIGAVNSMNDWGALAGRVHYTPLLPWRKLPQVLAGLDINLAPLVTSNPFAQSKSEIKYMEAGLVGVPTIASPTDAYCIAIQSGINGLIANDEAAWVKHLADLILDQNLRQVLGETARQDALENYSPQIRMAQLRRTLSEIGSKLGQPELSAWLLEEPTTLLEPEEHCYIPISAEQHPTLIEMGLFYVRRGDLLRLAGMLWVQFRRLLVPIFPFRK